MTPAADRGGGPHALSSCTVGTAALGADCRRRHRYKRQPQAAVPGQGHGSKSTGSCADARGTHTRGEPGSRSQEKCLCCQGCLLDLAELLVKVQGGVAERLYRPSFGGSCLPNVASACSLGSGSPVYWSLLLPHRRGSHKGPGQSLLTHCCPHLERK